MTTEAATILQLEAILSCYKIGAGEKMIFVARYNDGSCGVGEAENLEGARKVFESEAARFDPERDRIISVRQLSARFVSRWFLDDQHSDDLLIIDRLTGLLGPKIAEEICEHEYPMIAAAHATCEQEEPLLDPAADQSTPVFLSRQQLKQMDRWERNLLRRLRQAIKLEQERQE